MDRLTSEIVIDHISGQKNTTHFAYDFAGNICEAVDGNGNIRKYAYDDNNQLKSITYPDGSQEQYLFTADGKLIQFQDRNGITNEYQWNVYGSLIERKAGNLRNSYEYAPNGQLTAAISNGMDYRYSYDKDGLLLAKKASGKTLLAYTYDELGRKISQTDITGRQVNYRFDKSNHLVDICNEVDQSIVKFTRDADGAIQKITHANGMWQDIAYDADKNITSLTVATPDKILAQNTYRYDGNGQRIEKNELTGKTLYTYDSLNRLQQAEYPTYTERFTYDQSGNRLTRTAKDIEEQYVYDVNNRLMQRSINGQAENYQYDQSGNLLQDANNTYEYDAFRRTSKVTTKAGMTQVNRYDAEGLRYEMEENGKLVQFIFNENKEVTAEQEGDNITRLIRTSDLWAMESEPEKTWYHYASDEQGSTIFITDKTGNVKNCYTYDAFGNTIESEEQIPNRYKYTGQQFDQITQQYYLRARFYNPAIARFTQEDEYHGDGLNLYAYCANNPIGYYDPSGYACKEKYNIYKGLRSKGYSSKDAVEIMKGYKVDGTDIDKVFPLLKTDKNSAFFWSGRTNGIGGAERAAEIAQKNGGTTLEMMLEKNKIAMPIWDGSPQCVKAWGDVSAAYAKQVTGNVRAVVGTSLRKGNIWENIELPRLKNNMKVTKITIVDPKTEKLMTIFNR